MTNRKAKIAILFHQSVSEERLLNYLISALANIWREDGHEVIFIFGVSTYVPADIIIVHIDLSVVPDEYFEFAKQYPAAVNGLVRDIRKSTYSTQKLAENDIYDGRVIVKSDLNYAGVPERKVYGGEGLFKSPKQYRVYAHARDMPPEYFHRDDVIVEKFLPELDDEGHYCVRNYYFFGDRVFAMRWRSTNPIVNNSSRFGGERVEPDPAIVALRAKLNFDYGKFDYIVVDGKATILDCNKTIGGGTIAPNMQQFTRFRAEGLYSFFR
jgi:hypothetical protein